MALTSNIWRGSFSSWMFMWEQHMIKVMRNNFLLVSVSSSRIDLNLLETRSEICLNVLISVGWYLPSTAQRWLAGSEARLCRFHLWPSSRTAFASDQLSSGKPSLSPCGEINRIVRPAVLKRTRSSSSNRCTSSKGGGNTGSNTGNHPF